MIEINNLTTNPVDEEFLKKIAKKVLEEELEISKYRNIELSIALVGQGRIKELNKRYRGKNRVTDVLAFGENSKWGPNKVWEGGGRVGVQIPNSKIKGLGEIVICLREVKKNVKRLSSTFEKELARVLIHGILHLLGEDHEKSKTEAERMREKEEYYLRQSKIDN